MRESRGSRNHVHRPALAPNMCTQKVDIASHTPTYMEGVESKDSVEVLAPCAQAVDGTEGGYVVRCGEVVRDLLSPPGARVSVVEAGSLQLHCQRLGHTSQVRRGLVVVAGLTAFLFAYHTQ